jgi:uncharacterized membrane protein YkvA (DUF1232 family)
VSAPRPRGALEALKGRARRLKREVHVVALALRDPRVPWYARAVAAVVVAYAFSPIDLIPDFVPVLGYLDDLVLVPAGIALTLRLIPAAVLEEHRERADRAMAAGKPVSRAAAVAIVLVWALAAAWLGSVAWRALR